MKWVIIALATCVGILAGTAARISSSATEEAAKRPDPTTPLDITYRLYTDCLEPSIINAREIPTPEVLLQQDVWCVNWSTSWAAGLGISRLTDAEYREMDARRKIYLMRIISMIEDVLKQK